MIKYVLNLPEYQELSYKSEIIYKNNLVCMAQDSTCLLHLMSPMLKLILQFQPVNKIVIQENTNSNILKMNPLAYFVYNIMKDKVLDSKKYKVLYELLELGFSMSEGEGCVTPLTTLLLCLSNRVRYYMSEKEKVNFMKLLDIFIEKGVNIESSVIQNNISQEAAEWKLPDVLYLAFKGMSQDLVVKFLPHWWAPPILLLVFDKSSLYGRISSFCINFDQLAKHGGVPHGTSMFTKVEEKMLEMRGIIAESPELADSNADLVLYNKSYIEIVGKNKMLHIGIYI
jgi:hypothetical protein